MDQTEERWQRLETLFAAASQLPREQQGNFVEREAGDDPTLIRELTAMLAHASNAARRIAKTIEGAAGIVVQTEWSGRRFGPYRIVREIGRGGMGIVFEAVRDDDQYRKTVALKIAPWWRDVDLLHERFRSERQILAELEHPNIARFLDGGAHDGIPYFAMEYVAGRPITEYCRGRRLSIRERIELFQQVCAAVHYAHESLVVHRDLKPANILVAGDGTGPPQVKLLDFGIAKLLSPLPEGEASSTGAMLWTPDYTSPEQIRRRAITTRTDVYSLGLILYEILTGERAQVADTSSPLALDRSVCEVGPPLASVRSGNRHLRGDLDTIVAMAIRKEPERRYGSVVEFREDLRRYVNGEPVRARPNTVAYRAGKFVLRHKIALTATAFVAASLCAGAVATIHQSRRAEMRFQQVRKLANNFLFDVHDRVANVPGTTEARRAIVQTSLSYLENLRQDGDDDPGLMWELAAAYRRIGDVQWRTVVSHAGDTSGALASYSHAEQLLTALKRRGDAGADTQLGVTHLRLGQVRTAMGEHKGAIENYSQAQAIFRRLLGQSPRDPELLDLAVELHCEITSALSLAGDASNASEAAREAMEFAQRLLAMDPQSRLYRSDVGAAHYHLAIVNTAAGQLNEAATNYRAATAINEQLVREEPNFAVHRTALMLCYHALGDILGAQLGDLSGAAAVFEKALEIPELLRRNDPSDRKAVFDVSHAHRKLGALVFEDPRRADEALRYLEVARPLVTQLLAEDPKNFDYRLESMFLDRKMGEVLAALDRRQDAIRRVEAARLAIADMLHGTYTGARSQWILVNIQLAALYARAGDSRALGLADSAANEIGQPPVIVIPPRMEAAAYRDLGRVYLHSARFSEAARWIEKSAQCWRALRVSRALEAWRKNELAAVEADLAACKTSSSKVAK